MTKEEKQLLLKDLCARLPYGVMVYFEGWSPEKLSEVNLDEDVYNGMGGIPIPYLRPMSSMTEKETEEYKQFLEDIEGYAYSIDCVPQIDWLNAHHFDYRGLIEKGLALEAKEGKMTIEGAMEGIVGGYDFALKDVINKLNSM